MCCVGVRFTEKFIFLNYCFTKNTYAYNFFFYLTNFRSNESQIKNETATTTPLPGSLCAVTPPDLGKTFLFIFI